MALFYHLQNNAPKKNGTRGSLITGEAMLINQFGRMVSFYHLPNNAPKKSGIKGTLSQVTLC